MSKAEHIYQAIGEILATLVKADDGGIFLDTRSGRYPVKGSRKYLRKYLDSYQGKLVYWRVYPIAVDQGLAFEIVKSPKKPLLGDRQFKLQGDWVEDDQLQIWRNSLAVKVNPYNWQPRLLPISWSDAPAAAQAFWQFKAQLVEGTFKVVKAAGPFPHPPRLEQMPNFKQKQPPQTQQLKSAQAPPPAQQQPTKNISTIDWESIKPVSGSLELTIKINTLPQVSQANGRCHFKVDCDGKVFQISVKPKLWAKLETANSSYEQWVAALSGKLGAATADGFVLEEPNIQVFERQASKQVDQPKQLNVSEVQTAATEQPLVTSQPDAASDTKIPQTVEPATAKAGKNSVAKSDTLAEASTPKVESKPKKVVKFNVEIR